MNDEEIALKVAKMFFYAGLMRDFAKEQDTRQCKKAILKAIVLARKDERERLETGGKFDWSKILNFEKSESKREAFVEMREWLEKDYERLGLSQITAETHLKDFDENFKTKKVEK